MQVSWTAVRSDPNLHIIIMTTHTYLGRCDVPDISNRPNREERRKVRTGIYTTTIVEEVSRIDTGGGTEKNKARAKGTDTLHADALFAEFERGIRYEQLPPIVIKTGSIYKLIDGFTRVKALKKRSKKNGFLMYMNSLKVVNCKI